MKFNHRPRNNSSGFTLIEMSIVMMIVGLAIAAALPSIKTYKNSKDSIRTHENMDLAQEVLREYYGLNGRYPCPANPNLPQNDPNFGVESCRALITDPCPVGLTCTTIGSRDANGDGNNDPVLIGTIPARTLADSALFAEFQIVNGQDGFLMKITYAVSELMTDQGFTVSNPANTQLGAIGLKDEFNQDIINPADSAHYVLVSHGDNSRGAFTMDGNNVGDCTVAAILPLAPPPPGNNIGAAGIEIEKENCDNNDAIFAKGLRSLGTNDNYFDDIVLFNAITANSLWRQSNFSPPTESYLYNTNFGAVGIGLNDPTSKLHVSGNVRTETGIIADGDYCALDASDCLLPEALAGTAMTPCAAGEIATGIENNNLVCVPLFGGAISFTCPTPGEFVTSFSNLGTVNCAPP